MIFACELNTENLIGARPARANATNVSFFASRTQFQSHENHLIMYALPNPASTWRSLLFRFGKNPNVFFLFFCVFFSSISIAANYFYSDEHFFMTFSECAVFFCVFVSVLPFVVFLFSNMNTDCHVMSFHYLSDTPIK